MNEKLYIPDGATPLSKPLGVVLEALGATIAARSSAGEESYTHRLLTGKADSLLKKVTEEATEVALAAKDIDGLAMAAMTDGDGEDQALNHLRYESADLIYHLLVVLERYGITQDELAAELASRMTAAERPKGAPVIKPEYVNRG